MGKLADLGLSMASVKANQANEPLPKGRHPFVIEQYSETKTSAQSKTPDALMYKVALSRTGDPEDGGGKWVFDYIVIAGPRARDNLGKLKALCVATGTDEDIVDADDFDPNTEWGQENLVGRHVDAELTVGKATEEYPNPSNNVQAYYEHHYSDGDLL